MIEREALMSELWSRMSQVKTSIYTTRNSSIPLKLENLPAIQIFEGDDMVQEESQRGGYPIYRRLLAVQIELCINATSEGAASKELGEFVDLCKKKLYAGGANLGGKCSRIKEVGMGAVIRPPIGDTAIAVGFEVEVLYTEEVSKII